MSNAKKVATGVWAAASLAIVVLALAGVDRDLRSQYSNIVQLVAAYGCMLVCLWTALTFPINAPLRQVWMLISFGVLAWALGQSYFWLYPTLAGVEETPYPSLADAGFLLIGPMVVIALVRFRQAAGLLAPPLGVVTAVMLFALATTVAGGYNWEGITSSDVTMRLVSLAYVLSDPVMLAVTAWVAFGFGRGRIARSWWWVVIGIATFLAANQVYSWLVFKDAYTSGAATDALWPIGFGLIALGAGLSRDAYQDTFADA